MNTQVTAQEAPKIVSGAFRIPLNLNGLSHLVIVKPLYRA
jgi:hypothetical protein